MSKASEVRKGTIQITPAALDFLRQRDADLVKEIEAGMKAYRDVRSRFGRYNVTELTLLRNAAEQRVNAIKAELASRGHKEEA